MKIFDPSGVSVIVCCYNSASRIRETIRHLASQEIDPSIEWELVIVDNNCVDETVSIATDEWGSFRGGQALRVVQESQSGLCFAREAGARGARYDIIIFCDDDNYLASDYVELAHQSMKDHPNVGVMGGRGTAVSDVDLPYWFSSYQSKYAVGVQALRSGDITERGFVWGAGMVLRRKILIQLFDRGFAFNCSGRKGANLAGGDDTEMCCWFILTGWRLWYDERLRFQHFIPRERLMVEYLEGVLRGFKAASSELKHYRRAISKERKGSSRLQRSLQGALFLAAFFALKRIAPAKAKKWKLKFMCLFPRSKTLS